MLCVYKYSLVLRRFLLFKITIITICSTAIKTVKSSQAGGGVKHCKQAYQGRNTLYQDIGESIYDNIIQLVNAIESVPDITDRVPFKKLKSKQKILCTILAIILFKHIHVDV